MHREWLPVGHANPVQAAAAGDTAWQLRIHLGTELQQTATGMAGPNSPIGAHKLSRFTQDPSTLEVRPAGHTRFRGAITQDARWSVHNAPGGYRFNVIELWEASKIFAFYESIGTRPASSRTT
jgi:hypothetical protein